MGYETKFSIKIMPRNLDSSTTGISDPYKCKMLAQLREMHTPCFRFGKPKAIACCPIFNLIQILLQLTFNRPHAF